jgi:putative Mn2+ efflux pump MntP
MEAAYPSRGYSGQPDRNFPMKCYSTFPNHLTDIITLFFWKAITMLIGFCSPAFATSPHLVPQFMGFTLQSGLGGLNMLLFSFL